MYTSESLRALEERLNIRFDRLEIALGIKPLPAGEALSSGALVRLRPDGFVYAVQDGVPIKWAVAKGNPLEKSDALLVATWGVQDYEG